MELITSDFIYHSHHGVGRIQDADPLTQARSVGEIKEFIVKFQNGEIKVFTQELLERGAHKISPAGFRAYVYLNEAGAKEMLLSNPVEAITMVLQDFPGLVARNEDFKDYLSPYVPNWAEWWETAQPKLKDSPQIDTSRSKFREYGLRKDSLSQAEEIYRLFDRIRSFDDKSKVYDQARRTLSEVRNGASLSDEHLQEVLDYINQIIELDTFSPAMRLDAVFRLQEGKWLTNEQAAEYISKIVKSRFKLYQLDLYSLNRTVEFLISIPLTEEEESLLASAICSGEPPIKAVCDWALQRGNTKFIVRLIVTALSENIPPQLEKENFEILSVRLKYLGTLVKGIEIENEAWPVIISHFQNLIAGISQLDGRIAPPLFSPLLEFSQALYKRLNDRHPELVTKIFDSFLRQANPRHFILGLLDSAKASRQLSEFGSVLEQQLWSGGEGRNYDFIKELLLTKGTNIDQVKLLLEMAGQYDSPSFKGHVGELVCDLVKKDEVTDPVLFLPYLNQIHEWNGSWDWSTALEGLRETIYLDALERSRFDFGDNALRSAAYRFLRGRTSALDAATEQLKKEVQQASQRINELEGLLAGREQIIHELRSGYGGDTAEARFKEKSRIAGEIATSLSEFERMETKMAIKSPEVEAIILRLESILAGNNVTPMEPIGSQVKFSTQKHKIVDTSAIDVGDTVVVVERGYLIRDNKNNLRLLKPALVKK